MAPTRRIWRGLARRSWRVAGRGAAMSSPVSCWHSSVKCHGARCLSCPSRSCCCRNGRHFTSTKVSYWSRTVLVPLLVLMAQRPRARNPHRVTIRELFAEDPEAVRDWITGPTRSPLAAAFGLLDRLLRVAEPVFPARSRRRAIDKAVAFVTERLNGEDGLGGIFPAMANSLMMFDSLGYPPDHPACRTIESRDPQAARPRARAQPIASPACPRSGTRRSPATR